MFLSIFAATCRPSNIIGFLDNLAETADDPSSFEVLLKVDEGADELIKLIDDYRQRATFRIKYLATEKLDGYYSLQVGYNELLKIADPDTYFCWLLTDEIRFETRGWDSTLKKYIGFYSDDIFRIKLSIFQSKNYIDFFECLPCPDNYAVTTRKWLEITGGWGNFWGPDSWHQCVDYYLGLCKNPVYPYGVWRSFPIFDIQVAGQEAGVGVDDRRSQYKRKVNIWYGWQQHSSYKAQVNFYRLAQRLNAHIYANERQLKQYIIEEVDDMKQIKLLNEQHENLYTFDYYLPKWRLQLLLGYKAPNFWHLFPKLFHLRCRAVLMIREMEQRATNTRFETPLKLCKQGTKRSLKFMRHLPKRVVRKLISYSKQLISLGKPKETQVTHYFYDGETLKPIMTMEASNTSFK